MPTRRQVPQRLIEALAALLGDRLTLDESVREQHGHDESTHPGHPPDAVVFPLSTAEVASIVDLCARDATPIVPFGRGTALEGGVAAVQGGVSIDLGRMQRILEVHPEDLDVRVEAGVTQHQLNAALEPEGLFFSVDPGAEASLGGMASTRASGTNTVGYGTMADNTLALTVVLANGSIVNTARRARKSAAGYDLTHLFVGAEGTLGVITEVALRVYRRPAAISAAVCSFESIEGAVRTVIRTVQSAIPVARAELLDEVSMAAINSYAGLDLSEAPTLFLEFHGSSSAVAEQAAAVESIAAEHGGLEFTWTSDSDERQRLWQARHQAYYAMLALRPGACGLTTDVCVPVSRLAECLVATKRDLDSSPLHAPLLGHVGDGNFHVIILFDPDQPDEVAEAHRLEHRIVERALALDGTCTGEHGVGIGKRTYMASEHGTGLDVMRRLKASLDPANLMNPGKVLP